MGGADATRWRMVSGRNGRAMTAAGRCTAAALGMLLRDQPITPGKVSLAWRASVGLAVDRVTSVALDSEGALSVTATDPHWARELNRSRPLIAARLGRLLGDGVVKRIEITSRTPLKESRSHARVGHRQRRATAHR